MFWIPDGGQSPETVMLIPVSIEKYEQLQVYKRNVMTETHYNV
jgi:hypothetical protein